MQTRVRTETGEVLLRKSPAANRGNSSLAERAKQLGVTAEGAPQQVQTGSVAQTESAEEVPFAVKNPRYTDISAELPSGFSYYPFDTLSVRPMTVQEIKKVYMAHTQNSMRMMCEAVSSCLEPGRTAFELTRGDFYFVLYWLRLQSFKKSPFTVDFTCANYEHIEKVVNKELPQESLNNQAILTSTGNLKVKRVDFARVEDQMALIRNEYEITVFPTLMADIVAADEIYQLDAEGNILTDEEGDPIPPPTEVLWSAKFASVLSPYAHGRTLSERIKAFDSLEAPPDLIDELDFFIDLSKHGVQEHVQVTCKECGAKTETAVSVNALSFFPSVLRT